MRAGGGRDSPLARWKKLSTLLLRMTDLKDSERFSRCNWGDKERKPRDNMNALTVKYVRTDKLVLHFTHYSKVHPPEEVKTVGKNLFLSICYSL